jgi:hypothetical protein
MNNVSYQPSGAEIAIAQAWTTPNGYGTVLTPWTLDTDSLTITATPTAATTVAGISPVVLIGIAVGVWYFFFRKK